MAQAAKTRGRSGWVGTNAFGKLGRLGLATLKHLQYHHQRILTPQQRRALLFHDRVIMNVPPKQVSATSVPQRAVLIYSDAEYTPESGDKPKLGWVLIPPDGSTPIGHAMELPDAMWKTWSHRHQHIFPA